ncbi:MAG: PAS domain S-box protein [Desulfuromonadaceae bacterium]|nr:PAS domain S-box protein [Desulfuromonadaceae bacterium]MDD4131030.1 PAS domain S-box protein [Desulfuromonadaceae bacterium]
MDKDMNYGPPPHQVCDLQLNSSRYDQLRHAINQHAIVSATDENGTIVEVNDKFCAISGYSRRELIGKNHRIVKSGIHPDSLYQDMWATITRGSVWQGTVCNRKKDSGYYWVEATIVPILDEHGLPWRYISIRTDITAFKQAHEQLELELGRTQALLEALGEGVFGVDAQGLCTFINPAALLMLGYEQEDVLGQNSHKLFRCSTDLSFQVPEGECPVCDTLRDGLSRKTDDNNIFCKDGTLLPVSLSVSPIGDKYLGWGAVAVFRDLSGRKAMEAGLIAARDEAQAANQAKSLFLSNMSHELRTPLNAILGFGQLLEGDPALNPDQLDSVQEITGAGSHLLELVNEVLDLARIESGRQELTLGPIAVDELVGECLSLTTTQAAQRGICFSLPPVSGCILRADRTRLKQALVNLLSNAVKYNRPGGGVSLEYELQEGRNMRIHVHDTGGGIAPERLPELFQPFHRLGQELGEVEGTGIGLAITKQLIEAMGGTVGASSILGEGSDFWLELPLTVPSENKGGSTA